MIANTRILIYYVSVLILLQNHLTPKFFNTIKSMFKEFLSEIRESAYFNHLFLWWLPSAQP